MMECIPYLVQAGITPGDAQALRRIAMTLRRWHELECGTGNDSGSWAVVRGRKDGGEFISDDDGKPFIAYHPPKGKTRYSPIADREGGALKRLTKIMSRYPGYQAYVQTNVREAALYILRPDDVREGEDVSSIYNRGIAVYR